MARNTFSAAGAKSVPELRKAVSESFTSLVRQLNGELADKQDLILTSPDGTRFRLTVANDGTLTATEET